MVRFLPFLISLVLSVYALFSCIQTRDKDVPYLPKLVWIVLIVFVPFVGPITWLLISRGKGGARPQQAERRPKPPSRPVAPDDDPDFLATLERYRDPRTTVRPPAPGQSGSGDGNSTKDKDKDKSGPPKDEAAHSAQDDKPAQDQTQPKDKKSRDTESETPTESDDGKA